MRAGRANIVIVAVWVGAAFVVASSGAAEVPKSNRPAGRMGAIAEVMAQRPRPEVAWGGRMPRHRRISPVRAIHRTSRYARWITPPTPKSAGDRIPWAEPRRVYEQLIEPLSPPAGHALPLRAHGYYCFTGRIGLAEMAACTEWYGRLKEHYPTAAVVLNRELLSDAQTCSMLTALVTGDILAWVVPSPHVGDLEGLARFLGRYGGRVVAVVVGRHPMGQGSADGDDDTNRDLWLGFVRYALPGRPVLLVHHTDRAPVGAGRSARNADGVLIWNYPGIRNGRPPGPEAIASTLTLSPDKKALCLAGDWGADLPPPTAAGGTANDLARGEKAVADTLGGYVRCVGVIPASRRPVHTKIAVPKPQTPLSLSVGTIDAPKLKPAP